MHKVMVLTICLFSYIYFSCTEKSPEQSIQAEPSSDFLERRPFSDNREWSRLPDEEKLNIIFSDYYDTGIVKNLLGDYLGNFLEMFQFTEVKEITGNIIIEGFMPGGNRFTNGIIKIEGINISILFGYFKNNMGLYIYFTNHLSDILPAEFYDWRHFPGSGNIEIRKIN